jgi:hypothetical protein
MADGICDFFQSFVANVGMVSKGGPRFLPRYFVARTLILMTTFLFRRVRKICEKRRLASSCPSAWNNSAPTGRMLIKLDIRAFFENLSRKSKFDLNLTRITRTLHDDVFTFMTISL